MPLSDETRRSSIRQAQTLKNSGLTILAIAQRMGVAESTVRALLKPANDIPVTPFTYTAQEVLCEVLEGQGLRIKPEDFFVVWATKTLKNWKVILGTNIFEGMLYEVTYNGDRVEAYVDIYQKYKNVTVSLRV